MSKTFARSSLCALTMTIMTAHAAEPPTNLDKPEGRLDIIAWPGYIERGQTDKQYDWVTQFEKETGCAVNVKTAATSDEMVDPDGQRGLRSGYGILRRCLAAPDYGQTRAAD